MLLDALVVSSGADNDFEAGRGPLVPCVVSPGKLRQRRLAFVFIEYYDVRSTSLMYHAMT